MKNWQTVPVTICVNGRWHEAAVRPSALLRDFLRDYLGLTGCKAACQDGMCGHCTVDVDGRVVKSCMMLAVEADKSSVLTIEGLAGEQGALHPLQEAFIRNFAAQCGFCTPGMILTAREILSLNPSPSIEDIRDGLKGNLCRCTGYTPIVDAILDASRG